MGLHPPIPTITLPYPRARPGGWVVVGVHAMPLTAALCPPSLSPRQGNNSDGRYPALDTKCSMVSGGVQLWLAIGVGLYTRERHQRVDSCRPVFFLPSQGYRAVVSGGMGGLCSCRSG